MWLDTAAILQKMEVKDRRLRIRGVMVKPTEVVRNVYFDSSLTLQKHASNISRTCFYHLRRLRSIRKQIDREPMAPRLSCSVASRLLQRHTGRVAKLNVSTVTKSTKRCSQACTRLQAARSSNVSISSAPLAASPAEN